LFIMSKKLNNEFYLQNWIEFVQILRYFRARRLTILECKLILWHYYNKLPYRRLAHMEGKHWSKQYCEQVIKKGLAKIKITLLLRNHK